MIRSHSHKQLSLAEFDWPFQTALDEDNRWVKMSESKPPWHSLGRTVGGLLPELVSTAGTPRQRCPAGDCCGDHQAQAVLVG